MLPTNIGGHDVRQAVPLTFILNAGTDYGGGTDHDFPVEPYSAAYVKYVKERQAANDWSYADDVDFEGSASRTAPRLPDHGAAAGRLRLDRCRRGLVRGRRRG